MTTKGRTLVGLFLLSLMVFSPVPGKAIFNEDPRILGCNTTERQLDPTHVLGVCSYPGGEVLGVYFTEDEQGDVRWLTMKALTEAGLSVTAKGTLVQTDEKGDSSPVQDEYSALMDVFRTRMEKALLIHDDSPTVVSLHTVDPAFALGPLKDSPGPRP